MHQSPQPRNFPVPPGATAASANVPAGVGSMPARPSMPPAAAQATLPGAPRPTSVFVPPPLQPPPSALPASSPTASSSLRSPPMSVSTLPSQRLPPNLAPFNPAMSQPQRPTPSSSPPPVSSPSAAPSSLSASPTSTMSSPVAVYKPLTPSPNNAAANASPPSALSTVSPYVNINTPRVVSPLNADAARGMPPLQMRPPMPSVSPPPVGSPAQQPMRLGGGGVGGINPALARPTVPTPSPPATSGIQPSAPAYNWSSASVPAATTAIKPTFPGAPFNPQANTASSPQTAVTSPVPPPARILSPPVPVQAQVSPVAAAAAAVAGQSAVLPRPMMPPQPPAAAISPPLPGVPVGSPPQAHSQLPRPPSQTFTMPTSSRPSLHTFVDTSLHHSGTATPSSAVPSRPHSASPPPQPESNGSWPGSLYSQSASPPAPSHSLSAATPAFPSNGSFSNVSAPSMLVPQIRSASTGSSTGGLTPSSSTLSLRKRAMHSYDGEESVSPASGSGYNTPSLPHMHLSRPGSNHGSAEASPLGTPRVFFPNQSNQPQAFFPGMSSSNTPITGGTPAAQNSPHNYMPSPYGNSINSQSSNGTSPNSYQNNSNWRSKDADLESYDNGKTKATLRNKGVGWGVYVGILLLVVVIGALFFFNPLKLFSSNPQVVEMQYVHNYHNPYHKAPNKVVTDIVAASEDDNIDHRPPPVRPELGIHIPASPNQAKTPLQFAQEKAKEQQERMRKQAEEAARYRAELDANPEAKAKYEAELARVEEERKAAQKIEEDRLIAAKEKQEKEEAEKAAEAAAKAKAKAVAAQREAVEKKRQAHEKKVAERAARERAEAENAALSKAQAEKSEADQKAKSDQERHEAAVAAAAAAVPQLSPAESKARRKRDLNAQLDEQHIHGAEVDNNQHPVTVQVHEGSHDLHTDVTHDSHSTLTQMSVDPVSGEVVNLAPKFKFTVMNALEMSQCIGDIPSPNQKRVAIVGNSQARAFYFQLLNAILDSRHEPLQTLNRHDQKNLCAVSLLKNHENLHELTAMNLTPSCPIVLPHITYYYVQEFYDPVLEKIFESSPHMIVMMGVGMLDVMDSSTAISSQFHGSEHAVSLKAHEAEWLQILNQKRERLELMIKTYTRGGEHSFTAFALPPLCGSKYYSSHAQLQSSAGMALMTRVGLELKQFNEILQDITTKNGGNWFALDTYIPTSKEQNSAAPATATGDLTGSSLCSLYEDGMHAGLMLRKLVLNNYMNLMCKKIARIEENLKKARENNDEPIVGWNHKRNDNYTYSQIPLIDGGLKKVLPTPNAAQSQQMAARPTVPVIPRIQLPVLNLSPDEIRHCVNTHLNVEGKKKRVVFLGSSNMRSLYVTFMNQLLEHFPGVEKLSENRLLSKRMCNTDVQQFVSKDTLKASCPIIQTPPAHGLFSFIFSRSVWDDLVKSTFETEPDILINMAGYTELLSNGDPGYVAQSQQQADSLTHAIRNFVLKGRNYIEFTSPPVCEHKQRTGPRIANSDIQSQNALISSLVSSSGGNILDTVSFVQGLHHSVEYKSAMDIHGCMSYEDGVHPGLEMRQEITNALWNLICQPKLEKPFYFKKGDTMSVTK